MSKFGRKLKAPPEGFEYLEPTLTALDTELREKVNEPHEGMRKTESQWPVHQINWQRSRYVYDMYYTYNRISREVYDYCINNKLVDAGLIAKWKKPGYERLCSTFVINPRNYKFGSIEDPTTGCRGCASGSGGNIFGNKYGQYLAAIQIAREERQGRLAPTSAADDDEDEEDEEDGPGPQMAAVGSKRPGGALEGSQAKKGSGYQGPVGAADGGSGERPSVWAAAGEDVELDETMVGQLVGEAEQEGRAAARSYARGGGR